MMASMASDNQPKRRKSSADRVGTASRMFRGSRDFLVAYELITDFCKTPEVKAARAPSPIQSQATCAALSLELALKARIVLDGGEPPTKGKAGHSCLAMFKVLSIPAQKDVASFLLVDGKPAGLDGLLKALSDFEGTFQNFRYLHEHTEASFHEGNLVNVIRGVHMSIVRARPDFGPWPGVIVDPARPVRWHLKVPDP